MAMSLRVVVPPHPLIGHWLSLLRDRQTPAPLYATAMAELGRWLTYEALRHWLPYRVVELDTGVGRCEGQVVDAGVPILTCLLGTEALGLWDGARPVVPNSRVVHLDPQRLTLPKSIHSRTGVLVFAAQVASGADLMLLLDALEQQGLTGERLRVITTLVASPGLKALGERFPDLTIHTACIDPDLGEQGSINPGIGSVAERLFGGAMLEGAGQSD